jgi:hypothetical protein
MDQSLEQSSFSSNSVSKAVSSQFTNYNIILGHSQVSLLINLPRMWGRFINTGNGSEEGFSDFAYTRVTGLGPYSLDNGSYP